MKLIRFGRHQREKPGLLAANGRKYDVSAFIRDYDCDFFRSDGMKKLMNFIYPGGNRLSGSLESLPMINEPVRLGPPVSRPGKIVCIGLNFIDHARETGMKIPDEPVIFLKSPSAMAGAYDNIVLPKNSNKTDWEVELAVVIGKEARYVDAKSAMNYVAGFVLFNDYSEREFQFNRGGQWVKGKSADTFASFGPFLVTPDELSDYRNLRMWLKVNGEIKQDSSTSNMIHDVPGLIALISRYMTLLPGDIVSTGTPAGVGHGMNPPEYLREGDLVEYAIDGLGMASQKVVAFQ